MASSGGSKAIELVTSGQYHAVAPCIDDLELQVTYRAELDQRPELATLQLLGHIYNGNLEDARFVHKRSSVVQKQDSQFQAAFVILQHLWNKEYETVWSTFSSVNWAEPMPQLIKAISDKQRQHMLQLVSWAYSSIQPERLASLTGTSSADVLQIAQQEGWQLDQVKNVIRVERKQQKHTGPSSLDHLQHLTEIVVQLEA